MKPYIKIKGSSPGDGRNIIFNRKLTSLYAIIFSTLFSNSLLANNLDIGAPSIAVGPSTISFTVQWDNSWYVATGPANWDGVWVFIKRQSCTDNLWKHALVSTVSGDHSITGGVLQVDAVSDGMGVFIRRTTTGMGNIASCTATLKLQTAPNLTDNFQVLGMEMVNIPQGDFYIGDGTRGQSAFGFSAANPYPPILINNATQTSGLGVASNYQTSSYGSTASLPSTFPLGYNRFYCMKYEISQEQFCTFLNSLTYDMQVLRTATSPNSAVGTYAIASAASPCRNDIKITTSGTANNIPAVYSTTLPNVACNWLHWGDLIAYLDWAALRPMTEFEFEKICRGPNAPIALENAWGNTTLLQAQSSALANAGLVSEVSTASGPGLCAYGANNVTRGPLRCGFAATASTSRVQAGCSYYGVMDMSGNVCEQCIGGYNYNYSTFTTVNGDGTLSPIALADVAGWPPTGGGGNGAITRGGNWYTTTSQELNISDRGMMGQNYNSVRDNRLGGRGVRNW